MKPIPFPTIAKPKDHQATEAEKSLPEQTEQNKETPVEKELDKQTPIQSEANKDVPEESKLNKKDPEIIPSENCIQIGGKIVEIKPTKLRYFRNKMASTFSVMRLVPLNEFLTYEKGTFDPKRDGDQQLFDFLVAVFDDPVFVREHYDDMTADDVEKIFKIFSRLNHIDEKDEQRKNMEAQAKR